MIDGYKRAVSVRDDQIRFTISIEVAIAINPIQAFLRNVAILFEQIDISRPSIRL